MGSEDSRTKPSERSFSFLSDFLILCLLLSGRTTPPTHKCTIHKTFIKAIAFAAQGTPVKVVKVSVYITFFFFPKRGNRKLEKLTHLPKATKLVTGKARIQKQINWFLSHSGIFWVAYLDLRPWEISVICLLQQAQNCFLKRIFLHLPLCRDEMPSINTHVFCQVPQDDNPTLGSAAF